MSVELLKLGQVWLCEWSICWLFLSCSSYYLYFIKPCVCNGDFYANKTVLLPRQCELYHCSPGTCLDQIFRRWQSWVVQNPVIRTADADPTNRFVDRGFGSVNRHHIYHAYSWQKYSTFMFPHIFATAGSILYIFSANRYGINLGLRVCHTAAKITGLN